LTAQETLALPTLAQADDINRHQKMSSCSIALAASHPTPKALLDVEENETRPQKRSAELTGLGIWVMKEMQRG
jgi:hypothetical protein